MPRVAVRVEPAGLALPWIACAAVLTAAPVAGGAEARAPSPLAVRAELAAGRYPAAHAAARRLVADFERRVGRDTPGYAEALDLLVEALTADGGAARDETPALAEAACALKERHFGAEHADLAVSLRHLGHVYLGRLELPAARAAFERALKIRRGAGVAPALLAESLEDLAEVRLAEGSGDRHAEPQDAVAGLLDEAEELRAARAGAAHARGLELRAALLQRRGDYAAERVALTQALELRERDGDSPPEVARTRCAMGDLLWLEGRLHEARDAYRQAIAEAATTLGEEHPAFVRCLGQWGSAEVRVGDPTLGFELHERAVRIARREMGPDHPETADRLTSLANAHLLTGDAGRAVALYEQARDVVAARLGAASPAVAEREYNLAEAFVALGRHDDARGRYRRALELWRVTLGHAHPHVALALHGQAEVDLAQGRPGAARVALQEALAIHERGGGARHPQVGLTLATLALTLDELGAAARADELAQRALDILEGYGLAGELERVRVLTLRARLARKAGETRRALDTALHAERLRTRHLRRTVRYLPEGQALAAAARSTQARDLVSALVAERPTPPAAVLRAWDVLIRSRTLVLDETAARRALLAGGAAPLRDAGERARRAGTRLATLLHRGVGNVAPELLDAAQREFAEGAARLALLSAPFRAEHERESAGFDEVRGALPAAAALVAFARHGAEVDEGANSSAGAAYVAFVAADAAPQAVPLGAARIIDELTERWHACVSDTLAAAAAPGSSERQCRDLGAALARRVWEPLLPHLRGAARVFVVPDGALHLVHFAALPAADGGYLVETGPTIHYLSSERDLLPAPPAAAARDALVALGNPDLEASPAHLALRPTPEPRIGVAVRLADAAFPHAPGPTLRGERAACAEFAGRRFPPLPDAGREAGDIARLWSRHTGAARHWVLDGVDANEQALERLAPHARVLHLATHGFVLGPECRAPGHAAGDPLLLAGVVLAGANRRAEAGPGEADGVLTAAEAAGLDLAGTEWVVLSACDTGRGALHASEGVLGLRRAFSVAGARSVIMSLWPVEDAAARRFMHALYAARFERGRDTAEALREAGLAVLGEQRRRGASTHPALWAAFVAAGDWR